MVDLEAVVDLRCSLSGDRIEKPVWVLHVLTRGAKELPSTGQDLVRCLYDLPLYLGRYLLSHHSGRRAVKTRIPNRVPGCVFVRRRVGPRRLSWDLGYDLPGGPPSATYMFRDAPSDFGGGHLGQSLQAPLELDRIHRAVRSKAASRMGFTEAVACEQRLPKPQRGWRVSWPRATRERWAWVHLCALRR